MNLETERKIRAEFNAVCDAFEDDWLSGSPPDIGQVVAKVSAALDPVQLFSALLDLEIHYCQKNQIPIDFDRIQQLNPNFGAIVNEKRLNIDRAGLSNAGATAVPSSSSLDASNTKVEHADMTPRVGSHSTDERFVANQFFGRYQILSVLGKGGMGTVYLSEDSLLGRKVALKIPRLRDADHETVERFYREARAAAGILHRNICPVFDVGKLDGQLYITMAYIEGDPLSKYINADRPPSARDIAITTRKLALALDHAHRAGIVHRDLKPANVMIDRSSEPVVMDFGLALQDSMKDVEKLTRTGMIMGTPAYMSPEQIRDSGRVGPSADIYSLGVILFELLTGRLPFTGSILTVYSQIVVEAPPRPSCIRSGIDPELEAICLKAMAKDPRERFESMAEFAESLNGFLFAKIIPPKDTMQIGSSPEHVYATSDSTPVLSASEVEARSIPQHPSAGIESSLLAPSSNPIRRHYLRCQENILSLPTWIFATISGILAVAIFGGYVLLQPSKHELIPVADKELPSPSLNRGEIPAPPATDVFDRLKRAGAVISVLDSRSAPSVVRLAPDADLASAAARIVEVNCVRFSSMTDDDLKTLIGRCPQLRKLALNASRITAKGFEPLVGSRVAELLVIRNDSSLSFGHLTQIGRLTELRVLGLFDCGVEDQGWHC
ncbi:MAG: serine/threonine-protein kinase [Pirellulaceae bacterium]